MEKKRKTTEISLVKWRSGRGEACKHVVHWLSIKELANYRSVSQTTFAVVAGEDKERVPWEILSAISTADVSKAAWFPEAKPEIVALYRWFILHCSPFDPKSSFVVDTLRPAMIIDKDAPHAELFARLKDPTFFAFLSGTDRFELAVKTTKQGDQDLNCKDCACCRRTIRADEPCTLKINRVFRNPGAGIEQRAVTLYRAGCTSGCADWGRQQMGPDMVQVMQTIGFPEIDPASGFPCDRSNETKQLVFPECNLLYPVGEWAELGATPFINFRGFVEKPGIKKATLQGICEGRKPFNFSRVTISDFKALEPKKV